MVRKAATGCFKRVHLVVETQAAAIAYVEVNDVQIPEKNILVLNYGGGYLEASFFVNSPRIVSRSLANMNAKPCLLRLGLVKNLPRQ